MKALGVKEAVLTAKHGCGFLLWQTNTTLPDGSPYSYHVQDLDVLQQFSTAMKAAGLGHGFYYSLTNNFFLNIAGHYVSKRPLLPKQQNVTQAEFEAIALAQLKELWERFGNLTEIWFDGGYTTDMKAKLTSLLQSKQSGAIGYNGGGISANPARWSKTEGDVPPGGPDIWSTACGDTAWGAGAPPETCADTALYYPSGTDFTLQSRDTWFWEPAKGDGGTQTLRTLDELIYTYHNTVGHNTVLELDFAIDREGLVEASHARLYQRLGDWIRSCYGTPLAQASSAALNGSSPVAASPPHSKRSVSHSTRPLSLTSTPFVVLANLTSSGQVWKIALINH
jgi:alpha-L-fucosidase